MTFTGNPQQPVWRALFHPTRRQIIRLLQEKSRTTGELSKFFDVTRYAVMKHLQVLEQADLIHVRREGRLRWNVLNPERLQEVPADYLETWRSAEETEGEGKGLLRHEAGVTSLAYEVDLPVSAAQVYVAWLHHINEWWPDRSLHGSAMILEPFIGGRFYETADEETAGILLGFVTCLRPSQEIRLCGPMDAVEEAAVSTTRIQLEETDGRTHLYLSHRTTGEVDDSPLPLLAVWQERLDRRLRNFLTE